MTEPSSLLPVALEAIDLAAQLVRTQPPGVLTPKGDRDYASEVDFAVERKVRDFLRERTPLIGFLGEEEGLTAHQDSAWWTFDPIDGTVNFAHDIPLCGISLALIHNTRPVLGVIDLPFLAARYTGVEGHGAHRGAQRLQVRNVAKLSDALLTIGDYAVGPGAEEENRAMLGIAGQLAGRALRIRMLGSAAVDLAWLAEGKTDASITLSNRSWDVAAGVIIAREAGARVFDYDGSDHTMASAATIATAPALYDELRSVLDKGAVR
jgi:myo-inositol-1(or 4)-monophosphatase